MFRGHMSPQIALGSKLLQGTADSNLPPSRLDESLKVATRHIRRFGVGKRAEPPIPYGRSLPGGRLHGLPRRPIDRSRGSEDPLYGRRPC